ncbi:NAD-dependent epimerase/dehydratase family protein [Candidatus Uabimicrobium sp. HlEnr_7]|uniref:NAD-dependent epimerase/dehydratase family protein n=1 Tax=Candidatus Uabimicrobium helgolandensis TaxID=3095367 RepID=UPI0035576A3A
MNVLVIGGSGFIGNEVTKILQSKCKLTNIYRNKNNNLQNNINNIFLNRKDIANFRKHFQKKSFDAIIDFSAFTAKDIELTSSIVSTSHYILISSSAVYGKKNSCFVNEKAQLSHAENHKYAYNKIQTENFLQQTHLTYSIIRPAIVYGKNDSNPTRGKYFFEQIHANKIIIPGMLDVKNNYIHVYDLADLIVKCLFSKHKNNIINAGGPIFNWQTYLQNIAEINKVSLPEIACLNLSLPNYRVYAKKNKFHFPHNAFHNFVVNSDYAKTLYNWQPQMSLYKGLSNIKNWAIS